MGTFHAKGVALAVFRSITVAFTLIAVWISVLASAAPGMPTPGQANAAPEAPPQISGESAVVLDGVTGDILYQKNSHAHVAPASVTKIATAIVAIENIDVHRRVVVDFDSYQMVVDTGSTVMGLKPGDNRSIEDLLYGLMLPSGNDAAVVIARTVGGTEANFVEMMNEKVKSLGLHDTHFSNPHGLDADDHYSSAYDMAALSFYGMRYPLFRSLSEAKKYEIKGNRPYTLWNLNKLLYNYDGADGVKIGYTENALETIVASATRGGQKLIVAVMRSNSRYSDATLLLDYYFKALKQGEVTRIPAPTATPLPTSVPPTATPSPPTAVSVPARSPTAPTGDNSDLLTAILNTLSAISNAIRGLF